MSDPSGTIAPPATAGAAPAPDPGPETAGGPERVPAVARWFVRVFLVAFVLCAVLEVEAWPLTGFRLFAQLRGESRTVWVADTVGPGGRETPLVFTQLPRAYQGFDLIMADFGRMSPVERRGACEAWLAEARRVRPDVSALRLYRVAWHALPRTGDLPSPASRTLAYVCP